MNSGVFKTFGDELTKIAFFEKVSIGFVNALKEGWHGTPEQRAAGQGQSWLGKGPDMRVREVAPGKFKSLTPLQRKWQNISSLGGLTKALPVGGKAMTVIPTALMARSALQTHDPTGRERSRSERLLGLGANTIGGLAGSAMAMRALPKNPILAPMIGGMLGGGLAEKAVTLPFALLRKRRQAQQMTAQPQQQPQQIQPNGVY